jgi:putative cell wall-binding protein
MIRRTPRALSVLVALLALVCPRLATGAASAAGGQLGFTRVAGPDRFATAALLATAAFPSGSATAILATGFSFPDALAANYLAGQLGAPILLVNRQAPVPASTMSALSTLHTKKVILLGLEGAIGRDVQLALAGTSSSASGGGNIAVTRIGGSDRYDTMNLVDETPGAGAVGSVGAARTAIVASGTTFADALASGPVAYARSLPLILTNPGTLSPAAAQTLQDLGVQQVLIAGGQLAVSPAVEAAINGLGVSTLARFAGIDRTDTARLIGDYAIAHLGFSASQFDLASGDGSLTGADALALAPLAAREGMRSIQLVASISRSGVGAPQFVRDNLATLVGNGLNRVAGGEVVIPDATIAPVLIAYETGTGVTALPELVSAQLVSTTASASFVSPIPGTVVRFIFDEGLASTPAFDHFRLYDATQPNTPYFGAPSSASELDPGNPDAALVNFPALTTVSKLANVSLATVMPGAVVDYQGTSNPDGGASLGGSHTLPPGGGVTQAPDVESVGTPRMAGPTTTAVDLAFDQPAFSQIAATADRFTVVYADAPAPQAQAVCQAPGSADQSGSGGAAPGGNGTSVWTIVCPDDPAQPHTPLTLPQIARVVVRAGGIGTGPPGTAGDAVAGFIQATDSPRTTGQGPALSSASLLPATSFGGGDSILVTFDQPVSDQNVAPPATPPEAARFFAVLADGTSLEANAVFRSASSPAQVLATFAPGIDARAVAIAVQAGAVTGQVSGSGNADDEIAVSNSLQVTVSPGLTAGPGLVSVALAPVASSGAVTGESALLVFTQPLAGPAQPSLNGIHGYDADGTQFTCKPATVGGGANGLDGADNPFPDAGAPATLQCDNWAVGALSSGPTASLKQQQAMVLVTLDSGTIANVESQYNPEQAAFTTGGDGIPVQG